MKRTILICSFMAFSVSLFVSAQIKIPQTCNSQDSITFESKYPQMDHDTIKYSLWDIIIPMPRESIEKKSIESNAENTFFDYPIEYNGIKFRVGFEFGVFLSTFLNIEGDELLYQCKLGNVAESVMFKRPDNLFIRIDNYDKFIFQIMYMAPNTCFDFAQTILDNIQVVMKNR